MVGTANHITYLIVSLAVTVSVGKALFRHGRIFLVDCFAGDTPLADSVNRLLLAGFYLLNVGLACLALRFGTPGYDLQTSIEQLSQRLGANVLFLGYMHFQNLVVLAILRNRRLRSRPLSSAARSGFVR
jgi:hypothetical protein